MGDQGSAYAALRDVPLIISPDYRLPKKIRIEPNLRKLPNKVYAMDHYRFTVEKEAMVHIRESRRLQREQEEALLQRGKEYQEQLLQRQKLAARKIAPGFLDTDTRILKPEPLNSAAKASHDSDGTATESKQHQLTPGTELRQRSASFGDQHPKTIDYLKFEQGLAPPDPWDMPENDLAALGSILGSPNSKNVSVPIQGQQARSVYEPRGSSPASGYPSGATQYSQLSNPVYASEGYWTRNPVPSPNYSAQPGVSTRHFSMPAAPALPPKPYYDIGSSSLMHSSTHDSLSAPVSQSNTPPPMSGEHRMPEPSFNGRAAASGPSSPTVPPPRPPPPPSATQTALEDLVQELTNMGFSRTQAANALEKNDNDLTKAINFLLDQGNG